MDLYLIRHAEAVAKSDDPAERDEDRPLTAAGRQQARTLGSGLHKRGIKVSLIGTSPLLRARQTAEAMLQEWPAPVPEIQIFEDLAPGLKPKRLARLLRKQSAEAIILVGHMPDLSEFAGWLIGNRKVHLELAKAGIAYVPCTDGLVKGSGSLVWLVPPDWLT
jgi:phosphohistidine phosphatase